MTKIHFNDAFGDITNEQVQVCTQVIKVYECLSHQIILHMCIVNINPNFNKVIVYKKICVHIDWLITTIYIPNCQCPKIPSILIVNFMFSSLLSLYVTDHTLGSYLTNKGKSN